jgi:dTDP-glucose 4,6-dehydratase
MIVNALTGKELPIYGDGSNIRDWLYVDDHCRGIDQVIRKGRVGETYNIGGNCERNNLSIVKDICSLIDQRVGKDADLCLIYKECPAASDKSTDSLISFVKDRPGHDWRYAIDASKIQSELSFTPQEDFESGLAKTLDWVLANEPWWRAVMDGSYRDWIDTQYKT